MPEGSEVDEASLSQAIRDFVSADRDFFGLAGDDLLGPSARRIDGNWLLAFRQGAGGLPVRGANLRFLVSPESAILLIAGYLWRDAPALSADLPGEDEARIEALEEYDVGEVLDLERQLVCAVSSIQKSLPIIRINQV
ncbi:MAG: hypothetical protein HY717_00025 [Planctomycetes bacterium]|nr:hypothetical protein [Planctomycetota bacterium]